jgi:hypothetical protein
LRPTSNSGFILIFNGIAFFVYIFFKITAISAGSSTTKEGLKSQTLFSQVLSDDNLDEMQKLDLVCFMTQIKSRDLNLQNDLFRINWSVLMTVSFEKKRKPMTLNWFFQL